MRAARTELTLYGIAGSNPPAIARMLLVRISLLLDFGWFATNLRQGAAITGFDHWTHFILGK